MNTNRVQLQAEVVRHYERGVYTYEQALSALGDLGMDRKNAIYSLAEHRPKRKCAKGLGSALFYTGT